MKAATKKIVTLITVSSRVKADALQMEMAAAGQFCWVVNVASYTFEIQAYAN